MTIIHLSYVSKYSSMAQVKLVEYRLQKIEVTRSAKTDHITSKFLMAAFHKCYLVHSSILCNYVPKYYQKRETITQFGDITLIMGKHLFKGNNKDAK